MLLLNRLADNQYDQSCSWPAGRLTFTQPVRWLLQSLCSAGQKMSRNAQLKKVDQQFREYATLARLFGLWGEGTLIRVKLVAINYLPEKRCLTCLLNIVHKTLI